MTLMRRKFAVTPTRCYGGFRKEFLPGIFFTAREAGNTSLKDHLCL